FRALIACPSKSDILARLDHACVRCLDANDAYGVVLRGIVDDDDLGVRKIFRQGYEAVPDTGRGVVRNDDGGDIYCHFCRSAGMNVEVKNATRPQPILWTLW